MDEPTCFLSYSWDSKEHKDWVRNLATTLQENGVKTCLDQWDIRPGMDLTKYLETSVRESDYVLLICTPVFAKKANAGKDGVGYEKAIVTGEIFRNAASEAKFVPILREGHPRLSLPSYLMSRVYIDFRDDSRFESSIEELLRHIHKEHKYQKPSVGPKPQFEPEQISDQKKKLHHASASKRITSFKEVFQYAIGFAGMNLSKAEAKKFAEKWIEQYSDKDFASFKKAFQDAIGFAGMNLDKAEAITVALKQINQS